MTRIIDFQWWNIPAALEIERDLFALQPWSEAQFWSELAGVPETRAFFAAFADDEDALLGYADLYCNADEREAEIQTIAVARAAQGRGIGRELLQHCLAEADRRGLPRMLLEVEADNTAAITLYERHGFTVVGRRPNYYALGVDALIMERHV